MTRSWSIRSALRKAIPLGAVAAVLCYGFLHYYPPFARREAAATAHPLLKAIYEFRDQHGLWPQYVRDLFADHPELRRKWESENRWGRWEYTWSEGRGFGLWADTDALRQGRRALFYIVTYPRGEEVVASPESMDFVAPQQTVSRDAVTRNALAELTRRIEREPDRLIHYQHKISVLIEAGEEEKAQRVCKRCVRKCPAELWPRRAQMDIDERLRAPQGDPRSLEKWLEEHAAFSEYLLAFYFFRSRRDLERATWALERAAKLPGQGLRGQFFSRLIDEVYILDAATFAYEHGQYGVVLELLSDKERMRCHRPGMASALRSASYLALRRFRDAQRWAKAAEYYGAQGELAKQLLAAAKAADASVRLDIGREAAIQFVLYQVPW